jgi:urate oxidase
MVTSPLRLEAWYGKRGVGVYRTVTRTVEAHTAGPNLIDERSGQLIGADIDLEITGNRIIPAFTQGDNHNLVATDTMKNLLLQLALDFEGATFEGLVLFIGRSLLSRYAQVDRVVVSARERRFDRVPVLAADGWKSASNVLFQPAVGGGATSNVTLRRLNGEISVEDHELGWIGLDLIKIMGNSFVGFVRDEFTTLRETPDRLLRIGLSVYWKHCDPLAAFEAAPLEDHAGSNEIRDIALTTFHEEETLSIQHLVHTIGRAVLDRFWSIQDVRFEALNLSWTHAGSKASGTEESRAFTDPPPADGVIRLSMHRETDTAGDGRVQKGRRDSSERPFGNQVS